MIFDESFNNATTALPESHVVPAERAVLFPWVVQLLGVVVYFLLSHYEIPIPYVAAMFSLGAIMGMGAFHTDFTDHLTQSILQWSDINSATLLLVFLPGLIFRDAIEINIHYFSAAISQIVLLAFPVVLAGSSMVAIVAVYVFDWPWTLAMTLGAILGSTDPIAVSSSLKQNDAPERLQMHLGGESLINDGSAVVIYSIFAQKFFFTFHLDDSALDIGWLQGIGIFIRMSLGGIAVGIAFAGALIFLLAELDRRLERENNVVQVAAAVSVAFLSYYVSEQVCQMSGVLSCVTTGITSAAFGKGLISDPELMDSYLALVEHLLNTLLFTLGGVVWGEVIANTGKRPPFSLQDWGFLLLLYVAVMLIRVIQIGSIYPIMTRIGLKTNWQESVFLVFGGLRGAVGIALALALDRSVRETTTDPTILALSNQLMGLSGGVTFLTLLINGTLAAPVLRRLGLAKPPESRRHATKVFESSARTFLAKEYKKRSMEPRFKNARFDFVKAQVPFLGSVTEETVQRQRLHTEESRLGIVDMPEERKNILLARHNSVLERTMNDDLEIQHLNTLYGSNRLDLDEPRSTDDVLTDVRLVFLELLKSSYTELVQRGELDEHEDNGYNFDVLRQSVTLAMESVNCAGCSALSDFEYTQQFPDTAGFTKRVVLQWGKLLGRDTESQMDDCATQAYQQMRIHVLVAMEFIEAHRLAEIQLNKYIDAETSIPHERDSPEGLDAIENAVLQVLQESSDQVSLATSILDRVPAHDLEDISSRYLASILLHKLGHFIEQSLASGLLREKEASSYLRKVDRSVYNAHYCRSKHSTRSATAIKSNVQVATNVTPPTSDGQVSEIGGRATEEEIAKENSSCLRVHFDSAGGNETGSS